MNPKTKLSNNSSFFILIFAILKFRNIGRSTFLRSKIWPQPNNGLQLLAPIAISFEMFEGRFASGSFLSLFLVPSRLSFILFLIFFVFYYRGVYARAVCTASKIRRPRIPLPRACLWRLPEAHGLSRPFVSFRSAQSHKNGGGGGGGLSTQPPTSLLFLSCYAACSFALTPASRSTRPWRSRGPIKVSPSRFTSRRYSCSILPVLLV